MTKIDGMKIPNAHRAIVDIRKLTDYTRRE